MLYSQTRPCGSGERCELCCCLHELKSCADGRVVPADAILIGAVLSATRERLGDAGRGLQDSLRLLAPGPQQAFCSDTLR